MEVVDTWLGKFTMRKDLTTWFLNLKFECRCFLILRVFFNVGFGLISVFFSVFRVSSVSSLLLLLLLRVTWCQISRIRGKYNMNINDDSDAVSNNDEENSNNTDYDDNDSDIFYLLFFVVDVSAMLCEWKFTRVSTRRIWNKLDKLSQLQLSANCDRIMLIKGFRCCWCSCCCCCCCWCSCCSKQTSWVSALWGLQRRKTKTQFCQKFDLSFFHRTERLRFFHLKNSIKRSLDGPNRIHRNSDSSKVLRCGDVLKRSTKLDRLTRCAPCLTILKSL